MKKSLYLMAAAAVLAAGCAKEMETPLQEPVKGTKVTIKAVAEQEQDSKATYVDDKTLNWVAGDQIGVRVSGNDGADYAYDQYFDLEGGEGTATGEFSYELKTENNEQYGTVAFYPWTGWNNGNPETDGTNLGGDGKMYFHLFPTLTYVEGQNLMPLLANLGEEVNPKSISFKHVGGAVKIALKDVPARADKVTLTIAGQNITGWFTLEDWTAEGACLAATEGENDTVTITFDTADDVRDMTFFFPVPTTAVPSLKIAVLAGEEEIWSKTGKAQADIERGQILRMPELTVKDPASTYYLVGYLDGADYEGTDYPFEDGKLVVTFEEDGYVYIINGQGLKYWFPDYVSTQEGTLYQWGDQSASGEKMFVPGNKEVTFTLVDNKDESKSLTLSYEVPTNIERVFGKYATDANTPWSSYLSGFTVSGGRNVTMDDDYIYIADTGAAAIYMLNKADGSYYGKVKTDGVETVGKFAFSCPRILNLGDGTVLACTNMQETYGNLHLYVWVDGVDNDPVDINLFWGDTEDTLKMRIGDTWTFWQKAGNDPSKVMLYFDSNTSDGVRTWRFDNWTADGLKKLDGTNWWVHSRALLDGGDTNFGSAFYVFPENKNKGIWTRREANNSLKPSFATASKDVWANAGGIEGSLEEITSGYFSGAFCFQYFEFNGHKYISYIKRYWNDPIGGSTYALAVLEGALSDSWETIIANRANNLVYFASLAADEVGVDKIVTPHKMHPTHGVMDLCVRVIGDEAYITAEVQCSSLCTFKLTK